MLEIRNIDIGFETAGGIASTVRNISLTLKPGEITGLVGESGSGKTLIALSVLGLLPNGARVTKGEILVEGLDLLTLNSEKMRELRGNRISMVFQDPHASLDPVFTCGDQIVDAILSHQTIGRKQARARAHALLEKLRLPDPDRAMRAYPHELSGGQCQRVMIAMAVACNPDVIIADEPTTALDVTVQKQVLDLLKDLNREVGAAILLITHDLGVVSQVADTVVVMCKGDKIEEAPTDQLFKNPHSDYARSLISSMPSIGSRIGQQAARAGADDCLDTAAGDKPGTATDGDSTIVLRVIDLTKQYTLQASLFGPTTVFKAVDRVSLEIPARSTLGLVGESGCGKSTLTRLILQMIRSDSGQVWFDGKDLTALSSGELRKARQKLSLVFQNPYGSLNPRQTVEDLIAAPLQIAGRASEGPAAAKKLVDAVGLPQGALTKFPHQFSGGQRQRIAIARALALNPRLLICDEAVSALDVTVQAQVLKLLKDLQAEFDLTYLFISHDLAVVANFCDAIAVMQSGRIVEKGDAGMIFCEPKEEYTRELLAAAPRIDIQMETR